MPKRLTEEEILALIEKTEYHHFYNKVTVCLLTLKNSYILVAHSGTIDPDNFDKDIGEKTAFENALNRLWVLEGYAAHYPKHPGPGNQPYADSLHVPKGVERL